MWRLAFSLFLINLFIDSSSEVEVTRTCEPIRIDICNNIGYNVTGMPNFVGHEVQRDAQFQLQTFTPLIQYQCSSRLRFFLCSVYVPMCTEKVPQPIGPCRPLCEGVQGLCEPVLLEFGFQWPPALNCSQFPPVNNEKHMCMEGPQIEEQTHVPIRDRHPSRPGYHRGPGNSMGRYRYPHQQRAPITPKYVSRGLCRHLRNSERYHYINNTGRCALDCHADVLYTKDNKEFAQVWIAVWSALCFISTLYTIVMFFIKRDRFRYPEKVVIILSLCYFMCSIAYFIRMVGGREEMGCYQDTHFKQPLLILGGLDNVSCTIVFTLLYYFTMASYIWWIVLTLNWFLTSGLGWNIDSLEQYGTFFHLLGWISPAIKTVAILVMRNVDADELVGICFVGNQDSSSMIRFVLAPQVIYLMLGITFLIAGLVAVRKNKKYTRKEDISEGKMDILMNRVAIFAVLYTVPALCVLGTNFYEFAAKDQWLSAVSSSKPIVEIITLRIFMSLVVGITTGVWLYTSSVPRMMLPQVSGKLGVPRRPAPGYQRRNQVMLLQSPKMTVV